MLEVVLSFLLSTNMYAPAPARLRVEITNIRKGQGKLWIAMFRPGEKMDAERPSIYKIVDVAGKGAQVAEFDLEPGSYALAVYHDLNNNQVLDKNFVGIPKEPYGFSNDFRPKFSPPKFQDCAFQLPANGAEISVKLTD